MKEREYCRECGTPEGLHSKTCSLRSPEAEPARSITSIAEGWIVYLDTEIVPEPYLEGENPAVTGLRGKWNGAAHLGSIHVGVSDCASQNQAMVRALLRLAADITEFGFPPLRRPKQPTPAINPERVYEPPESESEAPMTDRST